MFTFETCRAESVEHVCSFLKEHGEHGRIVAGGTDLMVQVREKSRRWAGITHVIDIHPLKGEIGVIADEGEQIRIGALATHTEIETSDIIKTYLPYLGVASSTVGSPQIRNMGTIGGSICNASPAADPLTPLVASDALVEITGLEGKRQVLLTGLYVGKGKLDLREDEFVTAFIVPKLRPGCGMAFEKLGRRKALAISRLNTSACLHFAEDGTIDEARICPGCIFVTPCRVTEAEELVIGKKPTEDLFREAGEMVSKVMIDRTGYRWSTEYKKPAVEAVVARALCKAAGIYEPY